MDNEKNYIEGEVVEGSDSFDVGHNIPYRGPNPYPGQKYPLSRPMSNYAMDRPMEQSRDPTSSQNTIGAMAGLGAYLSNRYLSKYIGDEFSAALGSLLGVYISKKIRGK